MDQNKSYLIIRRIRRQVGIEGSGMSVVKSDCVDSGVASSITGGR